MTAIMGLPRLAFFVILETEARPSSISIFSEAKGRYDKRLGCVFELDDEPNCLLRVFAVAHDGAHHDDLQINSG